MSNMEEKLGYLTRAIEDNTRAYGDLRSFVENHMEKEESTISKIHKWLAVLTVVMITTHASSLDWTKVIGIII